MAGVAVVGSGNYSLEIDTGFVQDAFILDDAVAGAMLAFTLYYSKSGVGVSAKATK